LSDTAYAIQPNVPVAPALARCAGALAARHAGLEHAAAL
jgi:hypothetical protein